MRRVRGADPVASDVRIVYHRDDEIPQPPHSGLGDIPRLPRLSVIGAVFDRAEIGPQLTLGLTAVCPAAVVRQIQSCQPDQENDRLTLSVALKDHCSSFVANKISSHRRHSLLAIETDPHPPNAKLVSTSNSRYLSELPQAIEELRAAGLSIYLDVLTGH